MKTGNVGNVQNPYNQYNNVVKSGKEGGKAGVGAFTNPVDTYTPTVQGADPATIDRLWKETNHVADAVRKLVASAIGKDDGSGQGFWATRAKGGFKLSEAEQAQAKELIGEDGFFGVKKTTARIMDFAKALVGENASEEQIEKMRAAVQEGFDQVAKLFGGFDKLPDVTKDTYEAIMKAFDEWLGIGAADAEDKE